MVLRARHLSSLLLVALVGCQRDEPAIEQPGPVAGEPAAINLPQGWSAQTQDRAWFTSFGSRLMPYAWFLALEQPDVDAPFRNNSYLERFGLLVQHQATTHNPDALPVGFTQVTAEDGVDWVGLGCAACHTGEVRHGTRRIRIDGGQAFFDFNAFEGAIIAALARTATDDAVFARFASAVAPDHADGLRAKVRERHEQLAYRHRINHSPVNYGHGRLDAFGQIFNAVAVQFLGIEENVRAPDAPVSYPALWSAPHLDLVQWNGSAPNFGPGPLVQNVTTALAVYGSVDLSGQGGPGYGSTIDFDNLGHIQEWMYELTAPAWPEDLLGAIDRDLAKRGAPLYEAHCKSCHLPADRNDPERKLKAVLTPVDEVGTDPAMARNFLDAKSKSGGFMGRKVALIAGDRLGEEAPTIQLVVHAALGATLRHPVAAARDLLQQYHTVYKANLDQHPDYYKARPLDGIWATAPYLHNGSVPTLHDLLQPPEQRPASFRTGLLAFDPDKVGLAADAQEEGTTLLDTSIAGNRNTGHRYGTNLSDGERTALIEYLKTL